LVRPVKIGRRSDHHRADSPADRNRDHVGGHRLTQPDAGVEALADDVDQPTFGRQLDLHLRVATQIFEHQRRQHHARRPQRGVQPQHARRLGAMLVDPLDGLVDGGQGRGDPVQELLAGVGERDAAGGAVEEANAQPRLQFADGVAERR
jgi:hypothetical protein